jgi:hypothetical protein
MQAHRYSKKVFFTEKAVTGLERAFLGLFGPGLLAQFFLMPGG